ncbi:MULTISPECIES: NUDIX domain-containing protein [unclassified Mesobacillus]|uniref:NUDIX hydrolase n=1 Tax=unclassified Mesobacillus TaxID=2675270 RepID=UPI00203DAF2F|nr:MULTISPECIES: NUDIX domain-containing protein [unclassified Mesobacillus]MCM3124452.1 NUDIX domain-containing protein [Mesobacillus sp. MER 33]MCM3234838.1 NUDIX domain-containing protein [Mesobacillus sp. MER 48]
MMIKFSIDNDRSFHLRSAAIIKQNGKVLFQRPVNSDNWFLPGGRVEHFESTEETLKRELMGELNLKVGHIKLCWVVEYFLEAENKKIQELGMHYLVKIPEDHKLVYYENEFKGMEEGYVHRWIEIDELHKYKIVPEFVVPQLQKLEDSSKIEHTVLTVVR